MLVLNGSASNESSGRHVTVRISIGGTPTTVRGLGVLCSGDLSIVWEVVRY